MSSIISITCSIGVYVLLSKVRVMCVCVCVRVHVPWVELVLADTLPMGRMTTAVSHAESPWAGSPSPTVPAGSPSMPATHSLTSSDSIFLSGSPMKVNFKTRGASCVMTPTTMRRLCLPPWPSK